MGCNAYYKWVARACDFEDILRDRGPRAAGKYMLKFEKRIGKFLDALWDLQLEHQEQYELYERSRRHAQKKVDAQNL